MTPPQPGPASPKTGPREPGKAALLEALATAGDVLTDAIVHRDHDAIVAATRSAEALVDRLGRLDGDAADRVGRPDAKVQLIASRIATIARRNALLLEHAWATDAALLRLIAMAARSEAESAASGNYAQPAADLFQPMGWLDRQA